MKHAYIYNEEGMFTSVLGWILQQSNSYDSNFFRFGWTTDNNTIAPHTDPWDNHSLEPAHWSHAYIEHIEQVDNNFVWIDNFVNDFKSRSIFGLSYGAWNKSAAWTNESVELISIKSSRKTVEIFFDCYHARPLSAEDVVESLNMHIHDHHQDNLEYRRWVYDTYGEKAIAMAKDNNLEFWQLQFMFHHDGISFPDISERDNIINTYVTHILEESHAFTKRNNYKEFDILDLNLHNVCNQLSIEYSDAMLVEYNRFLDYSNV
jgi:hypothetical protein